MKPTHFPLARGAVPMLAALSLLLAGCGPLTIRTESGAGPAVRNVEAAKAAERAATPRALAGTAAEGMKLARLLRDQGRYEGAAMVYGQLEQRGELKPLELLEYASVAAGVQAPQDSLALYGRARRALQASGAPLAPAATATLCNGLGRARMALGQTDAALGDFDCTLAAEPDNVAALNAKGVLLDARGQHAKARELLHRALELDPSDFRVLNNLALSHLAGGETAQAIRLLSQTEAPAWPSLKLNLAFAQALQGDDERARQTLAALMAPALAQQALADFAQRRQRIREGAAVADELLAASRRLLPLREKDGARG